MRRKQYKRPPSPKHDRPHVQSALATVRDADGSFPGKKDLCIVYVREDTDARRKLRAFCHNYGMTMDFVQSRALIRLRDGTHVECSAWEVSGNNPARIDELFERDFIVKRDDYVLTTRVGMIAGGSAKADVAARAKKCHDSRLRAARVFEDVRTNRYVADNPGERLPPVSDPASFLPRIQGQEAYPSPRLKDVHKKSVLNQCATDSVPRDARDLHNWDGTKYNPPARFVSACVGTSSSMLKFQSPRTTLDADCDVPEKLGNIPAREIMIMSLASVLWTRGSNEDYCI